MKRINLPRWMVKSEYKGRNFLCDHMDIFLDSIQEITEELKNKKK